MVPPQERSKQNPFSSHSQSLQASPFHLKQSLLLASSEYNSGYSEPSESMQSSTPSSSKASSKKREKKAGDKSHKPPATLTMKELAQGLFYFGPSGALKHVQYTEDGQFAYQEDFLVDGQGVESKKDPLGFATLHMQVKP